MTETEGSAIAAPQTYRGLFTHREPDDTRATHNDHLAPPAESHLISGGMHAINLAARRSRTTEHSSSFREGDIDPGKTASLLWLGFQARFCGVIWNIAGVVLIPTRKHKLRPQGRDSSSETGRTRAGSGVSDRGRNPGGGQARSGLDA
ncbi:unnamed protein product [Arctogadus glacialis]